MTAKIGTATALVANGVCLFWSPGTAPATATRPARRVDDREQQALEALGAHRESLMGRAVTFFKGQTHYAREAEAIVDRSEAERIVQHRDLEAFKVGQFAAAQQRWLRQAQERKGRRATPHEAAAVGAGARAQRGTGDRRVAARLRTRG